MAQITVMFSAKIVSRVVLLQFCVETAHDYRPFRLRRKKNPWHAWVCACVMFDTQSRTKPYQTLTVMHHLGAAPYRLHLWFEKNNVRFLSQAGNISVTHDAVSNIYFNGATGGFTVQVSMTQMFWGSVRMTSLPMNQAVAQKPGSKINSQPWLREQVLEYVKTRRSANDKQVCNDFLLFLLYGLDFYSSLILKIQPANDVYKLSISDGTHRVWISWFSLSSKALQTYYAKHLSLILLRCPTICHSW
jgi:hypothetical protein